MTNSQAQPADETGPDVMPSAELVAEALRQPGGSVAEIDSALIGDPDGYIPTEAIRGTWKVDAAGQLTGEFEPNPRYGEPKDDFTKLAEVDHWLGWLGEDPAATVRKAVAEIVGEQVTGASVRWMKITDRPSALTSGHRSPNRPDRLIVTRAALAVPFALGVDVPSGRYDVLWGVYSVATVGLDRPGQARSRGWFDLWTTLDMARQQLQTRLREVDPQT